MSTTPTVAEALYVDNSWYNRASWEEVLADANSQNTEEIMALHSALKAKPKRKPKARAEATAQEKRMYAKQFVEAKLAEYKSWSEENDVYELVDLRQLKGDKQNYITGRWVLTIKRDKEGNFLKCKARWVLRGFQDRQVEGLQTDSPTATRPGFRLQCQAAANNNWDLTHIDLKTAFLQGDYFNDERDILCQLPPEAKQPPYMAARLKRAAYGLNDAPRLWWNRLDKALLDFGLVPTRADRCCYILYDKAEPVLTGHDAESEKEAKSETRKRVSFAESVAADEANAYRIFTKPEYRSNAPTIADHLDDLLEQMLDPITGSKAKGKRVRGILSIHVDDAFMCGDDYFKNNS